MIAHPDMAAEPNSISVPYPLDWTGNHFLPAALVSNVVQKASGKIDFTVRGDPFSTTLCSSIAERFGSTREHVAVGPGSAVVLDALLRAYADCEIIDVTPNFRAARIVAARDNRRYRSIAVHYGQHMPAVLAPVLRDSQHRRIVILSSPRNPFGTNVSADTIRELLSLFSGPLIVDECYADFASTSLMTLARSEPRLHVVRSFSKAWGLANLRIGFVVSSQLPKDFREKYLLPCAAGELQQRVAEAMLTQHSEQVMQSISEMRKERAFMASVLSSLLSANVVASDTNYLCVERGNAADLTRTLLDHGLRAARLHGLDGYPHYWPDGLRIAVIPRSLFAQVTTALSIVL
jgi:histidinol-phosphate aminotransferase